MQVSRDLGVAEHPQVIGQSGWGENHPDTLRSATALAFLLHEIGDIQAARDLNQDTLARTCHVLGPGHIHSRDRHRGRGPAAHCACRRTGSGQSAREL